MRRAASRAARRQRYCSESAARGSARSRQTTTRRVVNFTPNKLKKLYPRVKFDKRGMSRTGCLGFARVLRALPAHMLCALHTILVLVTMRLGCDASTLAKALLHVLHTCTHTCKVAWTLACVLPACTEVVRLTVACTRAACLPERSRRARRAGVHARCFGLASLDVHHVDVCVADTKRRAR